VLTAAGLRIAVGKLLTAAAAPLSAQETAAPCAQADVLLIGAAFPASQDKAELDRTIAALRSPSASDAR